MRIINALLTHPGIELYAIFAKESEIKFASQNKRADTRNLEKAFTYLYPIEKDLLTGPKAEQSKVFRFGFRENIRLSPIEQIHDYHIILFNELKVPNRI